MKKEGVHKISRDELRAFLESQDTYTVNRFVRRKFKRSRVISYRINDMVDIDLADFSRLAKYNRNFRYILVCIDVFSRFVKVRKLKSKTAISVLSALESIYGSDPVPNRIRSDLGLEFRNSRVKAFFEKRNIRHFFASPPIKAGYAERCIQTIKQLIYRYLFHNNTFRYVDVLDEIIAGYNNRLHRSLGNLSPAQVNDENQVSLWNDMYINTLGPRKKRLKKTESGSIAHQPKYHFEKGDFVRISFSKSPFERSYKEKFTEVGKAFSSFHFKTSQFLIDNV